MKIRMPPLLDSWDFAFLTIISFSAGSDRAAGRSTRQRHPFSRGQGLRVREKLPGCVLLDFPGAYGHGR